jgi:hypothetical protein
MRYSGCARGGYSVYSIPSKKAAARDGGTTQMELRLPPPGYYLERDPDIWTLRRSDGVSVAAFSARGLVAETIEGAAWEDHRREHPPAKTPRRGRDRAR